jgi:hypothetical protein
MKIPFLIYAFALLCDFVSIHMGRTSHFGALEAFLWLGAASYIRFISGNRRWCRVLLHLCPVILAVSIPWMYFSLVEGIFPRLSLEVCLLLHGFCLGAEVTVHPMKPSIKLLGYLALGALLVGIGVPPPVSYLKMSFVSALAVALVDGVEVWQRRKEETAGRIVTVSLEAVAAVVLLVVSSPLEAVFVRWGAW